MIYSVLNYTSVLIHTEIIPKKPEYERSPLDLPPNKEIIQFLNIMQEPKTFGDIRHFLKDSKKAYKNMDKNRKGLSLLLNRMIEQKEIIKLPSDKTNPYPRYTTKEKTKSKFESAFDGYLYRTESSMFMFNPSGHMQSNYDITNNDSTKLTESQLKIKRLVTSLGIQVLNTMLSSYDRSHDEKNNDSTNKENRDLWLKNALSFHDPIDELTPKVETILGLDRLVDSKSNRTKLLKQTKSTKKTLQELYPNITKNIEVMEELLEEQKENLREDYEEVLEMSDRIRNDV